MATRPSSANCCRPTCCSLRALGLAIFVLARGSRRDHCARALGDPSGRWQNSPPSGSRWPSAGDRATLLAFISFIALPAQVPSGAERRRPARSANNAADRHSGARELDSRTLSGALEGRAGISAQDDVGRRRLIQLATCSSAAQPDIQLFGARWTSRAGSGARVQYGARAG